jgi:alkanesulfonate monooxygenase SsuD/methylene tetrahydromethanopterin reductase-like flavin-dependent oxidoreductase (luciferase family)
MPDEAVDLEYLANNLWLVGSPKTVADRIRDLQRQTGGFGYLVMTSYDASDERAAWERSLYLLANDVVSAFNDLPARPRHLAEARR